MHIILTAIIPLFLLIFVGIVLEKSIPAKPKSSQLLCSLGLGSCDTTTNVLNRFALYLALPALIISSLVQARGETLISLPIIIITVVPIITIFFLILLVAKIVRADAKLTNTYLLCGIFGNIAYIGFPFLISLYPGTEADISILVALHIAVAFGIGLTYLEWQKHKHLQPVVLLQHILKNPLVLSVLLGVFLFLLHIPIPEVVLRALGLLGASASPVVLVSIGAFIASSWHPKEGLAHALAISCIKLGVLPAIAVIIAYMYPVSVPVHLAALQTAMPIALTNFALSEIYPMRQKIIANAIILSTLLSVITVSLWSVSLL